MRRTGDPNPTPKVGVLSEFAGRCGAGTVNQYSLCVCVCVLLFLLAGVLMAIMF